MMVLWAVFSLVTIRVWDYPRPAPDTVRRWEDHWQYRLFREFEKAHPGVRIEYTRLSWKSGGQKLDIAVMAGKPPDLAGSAFKTAYVEKGVLEPIDPFLTEEDRWDFYPQALEAFSAYGHIWAWPWYFTVYTLLLNQDLFEERGVPIPERGVWTWEEFVEALQKLTFDRDGDGKTDVWGLTFTVEPDHHEAWAFLYREGARPLSPDGRRFTFSTPEALRGLRKLVALVHDFRVAPPHTGGLTQEETWNLFTQGRAAVTAQGTWAISALVRSNKRRRERNREYLAAGKPELIQPLFRFAVANFPLTDDGRLITASPGLGNWVVFKQKDPVKRQLVMELARTLTSAENQRYLRYLGTFPTRRSAGNIYADDPELGPYMEIVLRAIPGVVVRPFHPRWQEIDDIIAREMQLALLGEKTPEEAMAEAARKVTPLLQGRSTEPAGSLLLLWPLLILLAAGGVWIWRQGIRFRREHLFPYLALAPDLLVFTLFLFIPVLLAVIIAFKAYDPFLGIWGSPWVGLGNFRTIFRDPAFLTALRNTFLYTLVTVPFGIAVAFTVASLLYPFGSRIQAFFRGAYYLPGVTSAVVISMVWRWIFDPTFGLANQLLAHFGLGPVPWLTSPKTAFPTIILTDLLTVPGGGVILYMAAMHRIPQDLLDSARVDGAGPIRTWLSVVLPLLKPTTLFLLIMGTIGSFQVFTKIYILTKGGPGYSTNTLVFSIYKRAFVDLDFGVAAAEALILFLITAAFAYLQFRFLASEVEY